MTIKALNLEDVFPFFFNDIGINTHYGKVMAMTLLLPPTVSGISLMVLVFFTSLALVGESVNSAALRLVSWSPITTTSSAKGSAQREKRKFRAQGEAEEIEGQNAD